MKLTIKLFANFRVGRFKVEEREFPDGATCQDVIKSLAIEEEELGVLLVNARHASMPQQLKDGDTVSIFPLVGGG